EQEEEEEEEEDKYYIFKNGTYSVGRKGCDIIIHKDKGVSRIHAHIMVDEMTQSCQVRIRDLSKYGTFINKNLSSNKKEDKGASVHLNPRPLALTTMPMPISARLTHVYSEDCTHVIVDQHVPLKRDLLDAIVAKKPLLRTSWLEYKFGDRLQSLLEVSGSRVNYVEEICSSSQNINTVITPRIKELKHRSPLAEAFGCGENTCLTYVIPGRSVDKFDHLDNLGLSYRVDEMALIRALLSGKLDQSILISSS
ncbi:hypothetical protein Goklo_007930, partial [Gossypium klotzschianum]|nr:hypothetical protein [Gossypium klotzschianum]